MVLDLGRYPEARFLGDGGGEFLRSEEVYFKFLYKRDVICRMYILSSGRMVFSGY